jgi:hypothetical protein
MIPILYFDAKKNEQNNFNKNLFEKKIKLKEHVQFIRAMRKFVYVCRITKTRQKKKLLDQQFITDYFYSKNYLRYSYL